MLEQYWDTFVIFVNAYYAIQEAYDSARRSWERPAQGLETFCRDANPFLWDEKGSAEPGVYESFAEGFVERFGDEECTADDGLAFVRSWLTSLEGGPYGTALVSSLDSVATKHSWRTACQDVSVQLAHRAVRLERTPQDMPMRVEASVATHVGQPQAEADDMSQDTMVVPVHAEPSAEEGAPSEAEIEAVIALLSKGDEAFAASLRARLAEGDE